MAQTQTDVGMVSQTKKFPPVMTGSPVVGVLPAFRQDPLGLFARAVREHGDIVGMRFPGATPIVINHPDYIKHVWQDNHRNYRRGAFANDLVKLVAGENLFTSHGDYWLHQRRLMQPAFHRQRIANFGAIMTDSTRQMLERRWRLAAAAGYVLDVEEEMMRLTLGIVGRTLFSVDLSAEANVVGPAFRISTEYINYRMNTPLAAPLFLPTQRNRKFKAAQRTVDALIDRLIAERRAHPSDHEDLMGMLMEARDEETGHGMNDQQLKNEISTMMFAGHETTSLALTWTFYLLALHPEAEAQLHAELAEVLGGREPTVADLPRLTYTRMVVEESMRLFPPAWANSRQAINPDTIGGYDIPASAEIMMIAYVLHRDPRYWQHPERFYPEHFAPEPSAGRPRFAYQPFGSGPRQCIGNTFALTEAQLLLATIAQEYKLRLVPGHPVIPVPIFVLRPKHGLRMRLEARN